MIDFRSNGNASRRRNGLRLVIAREGKYPGFSPKVRQESGQNGNFLLSLDGHPLPKCESLTTQSAAKIDWQSELQRNERWLRTIVYARLGEPGAVEDVFQEVALAAVKQSAPITDPTKVAPWLYRLAVRQVLLYRRKMGRRRRLLQNYSQRVHEPGQGQSPNLDPLQWLLAQERRELVRQALGELRRGDAEILMLKYAENWSYHQIADHLDVSHSAVEARLHRARERMRQAVMQIESVHNGKPS